MKYTAESGVHERTPPSHLGRVLIVEPDDAAAKVIARECSRVRRVTVLTTVAEATRALEAGALSALITEQRLPDGAGLEVVRRCRAAWPFLPVLVLTSETAPHVINRAHVLRAEFVAKPARRRNLRIFLRRAVAFERVSDGRVSSVIADAVERHRLSPRESDILAAAVHGVPRKTIADQIGTTENTIKTCVRSVLRKCERASVDELVRSLWLAALAGSEAAGEAEVTRDSSPPDHPFSILPPAVEKTG